MWSTNGHNEPRDKPLSKCTRALVVGCLALLIYPVEAVDKFVDSGTKQRIDTHNRLQLRAEQGVYQQSVEPLSPADRRSLELQLQVQQLQQRNLQLRQDQRLQAEQQERNQRARAHRQVVPGEDLSNEPAGRLHRQLRE